MIVVIVAGIKERKKWGEATFCVKYIAGKEGKESILPVSEDGVGSLGRSSVLPVSFANL